MGVREDEMEVSKTLEARLTDCLEACAAWVKHVNVTNGWYDDRRTFGDEVALLHSEVSEMLEAFRSWGARDMIKLDSGTYPVDDLGPIASAELQSMRLEGRLPKPEGIGSEAADVLVRLLDTCSRYDIDLAHEFFRKVKYNATRGHKHGGKNL